MTQNKPSPQPKTPNARATQKRASRYIPALDGLRALAVLAVIAYHMGMPWAPGGLLGVTVFFVLSGYLITGLLLAEWDSSKTINLPQFWLRRVRRLFPAIVLVIACSAALFTLFDHSLLTKLRDDMWAALLWVTNWWYIVRDVSYFDALGAPSPLTHFWSLAIEEQFYLVWPVVLLIAHKLGAKRLWLRRATFALAILSAIEMGVLFNPDADPSRVYYGTDTRAFSLLIGAWLSFVWPASQLAGRRARRLQRPVRRALDAVGAVALAGVLALMMFADDSSPFMYRGGILLASVLTAVVIAVAVHPASILGRALSAKPLTWIGLRSYGIYLWHYPLLLLITPVGAIEDAPWWMRLVELAVIFACAALSYRFVENPIRRGGIGRLAKGVRAKSVNLASWARSHAIQLGVCCVVAVVCIGGLIFVPPTSAVSNAERFKDETPQVAGIPAEDSEEKPVLDVMLIGDSVSQTAIPQFREAFPYGAIDSAINRQFYAAKDLYAAYEEQGIVGNVVVFALGTNARVTDEQVDDLMARVGDEKHVFFVNVRCPDSWEGDTNEALSRAAERYNNVQVIDWYGASAKQQAWFDGDGTHLTPQGAQAYINLIRDAIAPLLPTHDEDDVAAVAKTPAQLEAEKARDKAQDVGKSVVGAVAAQVLASN